MRHLMIAAATASILLAGCSGMDNRTGSGTSGSSGASASTSGNSTTVVPPAGPAGATAREGGLDSRAISPDESGMGQSPTRESLTNPKRAGTQ